CDPAAGGDYRTNLDGSDPARLGEIGRGERLQPLVLALGRHIESIGLEDQIGLPELFGELPAFILWPLPGGRHVSRIALRGSGIDPARNRRNLSGREGNIVGEL